MTRIASCFLAISSLFAGAAALAVQAIPTATRQMKPANNKVSKPVHVDPAERAFQANCNRCHYAPESLSPRITGTVVRHMRVRANLSAEEERLILSYLNP